LKTLVVILGPTGVGKTDISLRLAERWHCPILSADSRQIYKDLPIGTAAPTPADLKRAPHHFIGTLELADPYSASRFEQDALDLLARLYETHDTILLSGGSMLYIDALCQGIDEIPDISEDLREDLQAQYKNEGLEHIRQQLKELDPVFYRQVDLKNPKRVLHALEICITAGKPYSSFRTHQIKERPFRILKIGLNREREDLYLRINKRVDLMMESGLFDEARRTYPLRHLNSLNTVGYKELFQYFDDEWDLPFAIEKIKQNTRIYARKQMTWFIRDKDIIWYHPEKLKLEEIDELVAAQQGLVDVPELA
jgi:tRNA dimethylallyltransferase